MLRVVDSIVRVARNARWSYTQPLLASFSAAFSIGCHTLNFYLEAVKLHAIISDTNSPKEHASDENRTCAFGALCRACL